MAFATFCVAFCVACEKEETVSDFPTITAMEQVAMDNLLREAYAVSLTDSPVTITIPSSMVEIYINRCRVLFGCKVSIATHQNKSTHNYTDITLIANSSTLAKGIWQQAFDTKAIHFSSTSEAEMNQWRYKMESSDYYVVVTIDEKGTYHGVAYTKEEWDKLQ